MSLQESTILDIDAGIGKKRPDDRNKIVTGMKYNVTFDSDGDDAIDSAHRIEDFFLSISFH